MAGIEEDALFQEVTFVSFVSLLDPKILGQFIRFLNAVRTTCIRKYRPLAFAFSQAKQENYTRGINSSYTDVL